MGQVTVCMSHQLEQPPASLWSIAGLCSVLPPCIVISVLGGVNTAEQTNEHRSLGEF